MKKLIVSEVISVILVLGIFLLIFTFLDGWEKIGWERYEVAVVAAFTAAALAVFAALAITVAVFIVAAVATLFATVVAVAILAVAADAFTTFAVAAVAVVATFVVLIVIIDDEGDRFSLKVEAVAIIIPIVLITFFH